MIMTKINKLMLMLFFVLLLSISAVNANENNSITDNTDSISIYSEDTTNTLENENLNTAITNDQVENNNNLIINDDVKDKISTNANPDNNQTKAIENNMEDNVSTYINGDVGTFSELQELINNANGSISLDKNYTYQNTTDITYQYGVIINSTDFTINGNGFTINGSEKRIFNYTGSGTLTLNNIIITNTTTSSYDILTRYTPAAIYTESGNININNSYFLKNNKIIYTKSGSINVTNSSFTMADSTSINTESGNININNSSFTNNTAQFNGAIYTESGSVNVTNSSFTNNTAETGGAISTSSSNITVNNSSFINNKVYGYIANGGAIYTESGNINVNSSSFINNTAYDGEDGTYGIENNGGAIYGVNGSCINSIFINNTAQDDGGAIMGKFSINNSSFINNTAQGSGGAINGVNVSCINSTFINNKVFDPTLSNNTPNHGGAIYGVNVSCINSIFINNSAEEGGAILDCFLSCINSIFINNTAYTVGICEGRGGAINTGDDTFVEGSSFINNTAQKGGAIYNLFITSYTNTGRVNGSSFINNTAQDDGGAIFIDWTDTNVTNSSFTNNTAQNGSGGAIFIGAGNMNVTNSSFTNNTAQNGGAIGSEASTMNASDLSFINNTAQNGSGGAIYCNGDYMKDSDSPTFTEAESHYNNSIFINNTAKEYGGTIYWNILNGSLINNTMINSSAGITGDYIYIDDSFSGFHYNTSHIKDLNVTYLNNETKEYAEGDSVILNATVTDDKGNPVTGHNVNFYSNGVYLGNASLDEGIATLTHIFNTGTYLITGNYTRSDTNNIKTGTLIFGTTNATINVTANPDHITVGSNTTIYIQVNGTGEVPITGNVTLTINNTNYNLNLINGKANLTLGSNLNADNYNITVVYNGDNNYPSVRGNTLLVISKLKTVLISNNCTFTPSSNNYYNVSLIDEKGNPVINRNISLTITNNLGENKTYYAITNDEGIAKLQINLTTGIYTVFSSFEEDEYYYGSSSIGNITINESIPEEINPGNNTTDSNTTDPTTPDSNTSDPNTPNETIKVNDNNQTTEDNLTVQNNLSKPVTNHSQNLESYICSDLSIVNSVSAELENNLESADSKNSTEPGLAMAHTGNPLLILLISLILIGFSSIKRKL